MNRVSCFVFAVKTPDHMGIAVCDVVTVVGERFPGGYPGCFADNLVSLDDNAFTVDLFDHPLPAE